MGTAGECGDVQFEIPLEREPAEPDGGAAKAVGVARARRPLAEREGNGEAVDLVHGGEHAPRLGLGERATGRIGEVLLVDCGADRLREAGEARVLRADVAFQVGKLADELGCLVGLRKPRSLAGGLACAEEVSEGDEPLDLVAVCARSRHEGDPRRFLGETLDSLRDVALEGEGRVFQAPFEHGLVAGDHRLRIAAVGHEREAVAFEREVALVRLHRRLDHAPREREEALVEGSLENRRPLGQMDDLREHLLVRIVKTELLKAGPDGTLPSFGVRLDVSRPKRLEVVAGTGDRHLPVREAVAEGGTAEALDGLIVDLRAEPADGAREAEPRIVPAHRLGEGEAAQDLVQSLRQRLEQRPAGNEDAEKAVAHLEVGDAHALLARKALRGLVAQVLRGALDPLVCLALGQVLHEQDEPARPDEDAAFPELRELGTKLSLRLDAGRGGQLLAADLKQQARQSSPRRAEQPCARACVRGRCTRRVRSPRRHRARRAG